MSPFRMAAAACASRRWYNATSIPATFCRAELSGKRYVFEMCIRDRAKLLLRFHDATKGAIRLDGVDLRELSQDEIRGHIACVPQKAWLFSGTVASNLRFGNEDATETDMLPALQVAQSTFVLDQPQGLDTPVAQGLSLIHISTTRMWLTMPRASARASVSC